MTHPRMMGRASIELRHSAGNLVTSGGLAVAGKTGVGHVCCGILTSSPWPGGCRTMRKIMSMWEDLHTMGCPDLREDVELEGRLAILDFYMISYIDEFIQCNGSLAASSIVHLSNSKRELASLLKRLDGWQHSYFELLLQLARAVLRRTKGQQAHLIVPPHTTGAIG